MSFGAGVVAGTEAIHNLCLISKIMLQKSCGKYKCNIILFEIAFIHIQI
jgi:hypothetical protein